jgi:DNA-binding cell septation regulator SpoVG
MWALIDRGRVSEVTDIDPADRFHPDIEWVEAEPGVQVGMIYDGSSFSDVATPISVPSRAEVEAARLRAYADPITGSDRYFAEASRLRSMGADQSEIDAVRAAGAARYSEIQADNPWPEGVDA